LDFKWADFVKNSTKQSYNFANLKISLQETWSKQNPF